MKISRVVSGIISTLGSRGRGPQPSGCGKDGGPDGPEDVRNDMADFHIVFND